MFRFVFLYFIWLFLESDWFNVFYNVIFMVEYMVMLWNEIVIFLCFGKIGLLKLILYVKLREFCDVFKIVCKEFSFVKNKYFLVC